MTTTPRTEAIATLADLIVSAYNSAVVDDDIPDPDYLVSTMRLRSILTPSDFTDLCLQLDLCPMHVCDVEICDDDEDAECKEIRHG